MDLYKHAFRLTPLVASELVADCFELAWDIRELDMRASPYDFSDLGFEPVRIETPEGKQEYVAAQRAFAERGAPLRQRLIDECDRLLGCGSERADAASPVSEQPTRWSAGSSRTAAGDHPEQAQQAPLVLDHIAQEFEPVHLPETEVNEVLPATTTTTPPAPLPRRRGLHDPRGGVYWRSGGTVESRRAAGHFPVACTRGRAAAASSARASAAASW